jgi:uncharacterized damage-inducible protein DinB
MKVPDLLSYRDMFDYFKKERARLIDALEKLPQKELERNREISFLSLKDVLIHTVMVEDNWLHYRAAGLGSGTSLKPEDFKNLQDVKKYIVEVDSKTAKLFSGMTEKDLGKEVRRTSREGKEEVFTLEQILYHVPIEIIHHFGEIFAEFWKMDIDAPYYSYLAYSKDKMGNRST